MAVGVGPVWRTFEDMASGAPEVSCDRAKRSEPCDMTLVGMVGCGDCCKVYVRCRRHGGEAGAKKSLHAHRALYHPKENPT